MRRSLRRFAADGMRVTPAEARCGRAMKQRVRQRIDESGDYRVEVFAGNCDVELRCNGGRLPGIGGRAVSRQSRARADRRR